MKITAIYPGTFDPITDGHTDIVIRAAKLFDTLYLSVAEHVGYETLFAAAEREILARTVLSELDNVKVCRFNCLVTEHAKALGAVVIVRGIRTSTDFDYEFRMAGMNKRLYEHAETVFLHPADDLSYISSTLVREVSYLGGDVSRFVHPVVLKALNKKHCRASMT